MQKHNIELTSIAAPFFKITFVMLNKIIINDSTLKVEKLYKISEKYLPRWLIPGLLPVIQNFSFSSEMWKKYLNSNF